ncbi:MAG: RNA ligase family protein [Candidatus Omnitrophota bacterium]
METILADFPKLYCPFIRQTFKVNPDHYKQYGPLYQLRAPEVYLAVDLVNPGYEWVFEDKDTIAVEKLNGTNIKILTRDNNITAVQNRKNIIDPLEMKGICPYVMEGIFRAAQLDFVKPDAEQAGELIGTKLQGNPYRLDGHLWYPFDIAAERLKYNSFNKHPKTFEDMSDWFREWLFSRLYEKKAAKEHLGGAADKVFAEGVIFYNFRREAEEKTWRAKLRRDMFPWYYGKIEIYDYDRSGRPVMEDQEKFD